MIAKQGQSREAMHNSQQPRSPRLLRVHCHRANVHSGQWCAVTYYQPVARPDCREHCWLRIMCLPVPKPGGSRRMCDKYMNLRPATTSNNCESRRAWERKCVAAHGLLGRACRYKIHDRYLVGRDRPASSRPRPQRDDPSICSTKCQSGCNFGTDGEPSHLPTRAITALREEGGKNMCGAGVAEHVRSVEPWGPPQPVSDFENLKRSRNRGRSGSDRLHHRPPPNPGKPRSTTQPGKTPVHHPTREEPGCSETKKSRWRRTAVFALPRGGEEKLHVRAQRIGARHRRAQKRQTSSKGGIAYRSSSPATSP